MYFCIVIAILNVYSPVSNIESTQRNRNLLKHQCESYLTYIHANIYLYEYNKLSILHSSIKFLLKKIGNNENSKAVVSKISLDIFHFQSIKKEFKTFIFLSCFPKLFIMKLKKIGNNEIQKQWQAKYHWIFSTSKAQRQVHAVSWQEGNSAFRFSVWLLPPLNYKILATPMGRMWAGVTSWPDPVWKILCSRHLNITFDATMHIPVSSGIRKCIRRRKVLIGS